MRAAFCLVLSAALLGCSSAEAPVAATAVAPRNLQASLLPVEPKPPSSAPVARRVYTVEPAVARQALEDARAAMLKKQWDTLDSLVPLAQEDELLGAYADYWLLRRRLDNANEPMPTAALDAFVAENRDPYLSNRLRGDWIVAAAKRGDYATAAGLGLVDNSSPEVDCSRLLALHMTGKKVSSSEAMGVFRPGPACWRMLDLLHLEGAVAWEDIQSELRATLETSRTGNATRLAGYLFAGEQMSAYRALMRDPQKWLSNQGRPTDRASTELITIALSRLARKDREAGEQFIEQNWAGALPRENLEWVWGQFGLIAALNVEPRAVRWYRRSGTAPMTDYNHAWEVRSELRQAVIDWGRVRQAIGKMSAAQQAEPVWVYWYGRALLAQGHREDAMRYFASIEKELDFYGQLATEELGKTISLPPLPSPVTQAELAAAQANPGLQRAVALFHLGWRPEAVPEWNYALRGMSDRELRAAAEFARNEGIYDRVVNTSLQTRREIDFSQRFVAPFEGRVTAKAREIGLDPAWVYGLIRQESRFITDARSRVGASGLMQLMPATAKWVARKIGLQGYTPASVNDFDTNTLLGTSYLKIVLNGLDGSELLATAGYNAGPGRPKQWRSRLAGPVEGAIFAETIPFTETRLYVKHVLSNANYYAMLFTGQPHSLKERLGMVAMVP